MRRTETLRDAAAARLGVLLRGRFLRVLGGAALATLAARAAQFGMALALGMQLGPAGFGQVAFALGAGTLAGQLGAGGWPALAVRRTEALAAQPERLRRLMAVSSRAALRGGLLAALLLGGSAVSASRLGAAGLAEGLALAALVAPGAALRRLGRQQLSALFRPATGVALEDLAAPAATLAAAMAAIPLGGLAGAGVATGVFAAAGGAAGWASLALARRGLGAPADGLPEAERMWASEARALLPSLAPRMLLARADMLLIAPLLGFEAAGFYAAAQRLAFLVSAPPLLLAQVLQPWASRALHAGDRRRLLGVLGGGTAAVLAWATPAVTLVLAFPEAPAALFGEAFAAAGRALAPLALAEMAASIAAPLMVVAISGPWTRALGRAGLALAAGQALAIAVVAPSADVEGAAWTVCAASAGLTAVTALAALGALPRAPGR